MKNMGSFRSDIGINYSSTSTSCCNLKLVIRALAVTGLVWILLVSSPVLSPAHQVVVRTEKFPKVDDHHLIAHISKRRVPNGPDPIHNRRAGKSGKPPGQA